MKKHFIYLGVIALLLVVISINRCSSQKPKVVTHTKVDSTTVDSLTKRIKKLEDVPPETVRVTVEVPSTPDTVYKDKDGATVREFTSIYTDSVISASWQTGTTGWLKYQDFQYTLKRRPTYYRETTKYITKYRTTTRTVTKRIGGFLSIGGDIGYSPLTNSLGSVELRYQAKDGYSYHIRYDPFTEGKYIGITIPIRLNIPFL